MYGVGLGAGIAMPGRLAVNSTKNSAGTRDSGFGPPCGSREAVRKFIDPTNLKSRDLKFPDPEACFDRLGWVSGMLSDFLGYSISILLT